MACQDHTICDCQRRRLQAAEDVIAALNDALESMPAPLPVPPHVRAAWVRVAAKLEVYADTLPPEA